MRRTFCFKTLVQQEWEAWKRARAGKRRYLKRGKIWKERKRMQSDKVFSDWTSMFFTSRYTTCIQRWPGKVLSCSARPKQLPLAPSEVEVAQLCSVLLQNSQQRQAQCIAQSLWSSSKEFPPFWWLMCCLTPTSRGSKENHGSVPSCAMPCVPVPMPQEVPRAAHRGHCSHGHHARGAAGPMQPGEHGCALPCSSLPHSAPSKAAQRLSFPHCHPVKLLQDSVFLSWALSWGMPIFCCRGKTLGVPKETQSLSSEPGRTRIMGFQTA